MADIKTNDMKPKTVKTIDKAVAWTERIKDPVVYANKKNDNMTLISRWSTLPKSNVITS